ncbi:TonB-dependent copper receptor|uniref:Iron complex outermembrane recepter protein n=1 Tax=Dendrosporobacter quercicolus TaxID=146817 RepID=A0A1G9S0H0_9FIRM|nr:TonB-dependent copper receptor [Dendrosporobacter quercicolus]NSL49505.1 TonB-dependent copper receptor [Dendrosporobacter quercicolus DSM 1736]SDM28991.1 iron complex outermembrane recepter protein [Dendrosporobacter quercicolus]
MNQVRTFVVSSLILLSAATTGAQSALAAEDEDKITFWLDEIVVTAPVVSEPLTVETDPKSPRLPVPAADGGGYLKNIPGFSAARQGGTGGDPVFRGLGGTRLNVLLNGAYQFGACPGRMDPTTSYVFPEAYNRITVLKGPETVKYGGGNVAGTIYFARDTPLFDQPEVRVSSSVLLGSAGRDDELLDVTAGDPRGYVRIIKTRSNAHDYNDGNGNKVHSFYTRQSLTGIFGWTPEPGTLYEFTADTSDAEAAYSGRAMDGPKFDRNDYTFKFSKKNISPLISNLEFQAFHNYVDHVMDNYSLRPNSSMMNMAMEVDRTTNGGRLAADLALGEATTATVGIDYQRNKHAGRMAMAMMGKPAYTAGMARDLTFTNEGVFGEFKRRLDTSSRLLAGVRTDSLRVKNEKTAEKGHDRTYGAFLRYEYDYANAPVTSYIGLGHAQRPADYWERRVNFYLKPEKNTQLDTGLIYRSGRLSASLALFYANINDFILFKNQKSTAQNIDASLYGGEVELIYPLDHRWTATASLAYVRGNNQTEHKPLAQIPPLEGRLGLKYKHEKVEAGLLWRGVQAQNRYDLNSGSEIGYDLGASSGFGILSASIAYQAASRVTVAAGVDNIFDKNYAEFISRSGVAIPALDIASSFRINEPGRTVWIKASYNY